MHLRTLLGLVLLLGGLALLVRWQAGRERHELAGGAGPLFEGAHAARIERIRVDNLERSVQLLLELHPGEGWTIVDPIHAPAEGALVQLLLDALTTQQALPVEGGDPAKLSLAPPRAVLEFEERVGEERVRRRLELGANDLDGEHAFVRADGRIARTLRTFETLLDRSAEDWRSRSIVRGVDPREVVELRRRGELALEPGAPPASLDLSVVQDDGWRATEPWRALLDPGAVGLLLQTACSLRAADFIDDAPIDVGVYGLDRPALELELELASGRAERLRFASKDGDEWYALASSDPRVYSVADEALRALAQPAEALVERQLWRLVRERVARIELAAGGREVVLVRDAGGDFELSVDGGAPRAADAARVGDLLTALEGERVLALLPGVPFEDGPAGPARIVLEHDGRRLGGALGRPHELPGGGQGLLFRRVGDDLVTLVEARLWALAATDPEGLFDLKLVRVAELDLARIELRRGERTASYAIDRYGRWTELGTETEARDFALLVDKLLALSAAELLDGDGQRGALVDPISVRLVRKGGASIDYQLGSRFEGLEPGDPELYAFRSAGQAPRDALVRGGLHRELAALLEAE